MTNSKILRIGSMAIALIALLAAPAFAQTTGDAHGPEHGVPGEHVEDDKAFDQLVRGIDVLPDREAMEERWPDADKRLIDVATDTDNTEYERWRATSLLANFSGDHVRDTLVELTDDSTDRVRQQAFYTLGTAFLEEGDDELFELLKQGLAEDSESIRIRIVRSLGWTDHTGAHELLEELKSCDERKELNSHAERALDRID